MKNGGGESCQAEDVHDERKEISYDQLLTPGPSTFWFFALFMTIYAKPACVFNYMCECTACVSFVRTPAFFCVYVVM
jgi:hypothetical protein